MLISVLVLALFSLVQLMTIQGISSVNDLNGYKPSLWVHWL